MAIPCSFHRAMIYLVSTCNHSYRWSLFCILLPLPNPLVSRKISYWLRLVMVLRLKPMVSWWNRGPPVNVHTWMCCSARAGITVSSCYQLWDLYQYVISSQIVLPREIHCWCQFGDGVMIKDLWYRGETESLMWMHTQDFAAWRMRVPRSLVMIYYGTTLMCYLPLTFPWNDFDVVCRSDQATPIDLLDQKGIPLPCVVSFLWS
jgi:hypothetical protein